MIRRPFEQWLFEDVELTFGLEPNHQMKELLNWLKIEQSNTSLSTEIEKLRLFLEQQVGTLNEYELNSLFIAPFLSLFQFNYPSNYRIFCNRLLEVETNEVISSGRISWIIAKGKQTTRLPFLFFIHINDYWSLTIPKGENDALGQLLMAMLSGQSKEKQLNQLLLGCFIVERHWYFVLLKGKEYGVSKAYDATQLDDISDMVVILKRVETHIKTELGLL